MGEARSAGLKFAVLTDHDGVGGYENYAEGVRKWWKPLCASELSCTFLHSGRETELHLLIYGLNPADASLQEKFARFRQERETRFFKMGEKLAEAGYKIDTEALARRHPGVLGRPHIADALVEAGYASDRLDAFAKFLKDGCKYHVKKWRFPLEDAVAYAKKAGCKTSIAHPGQYRFRETELTYFKDLGLDAIEVFHPRHDPSDLQYYRDAAKRYGFQISGGSDFHSDETDLVDRQVSLGRAAYPFDLAKSFLKDLL